MKTNFLPKRICAMTLIEVLIVLAVLTVLAAMILPATSKPKGYTLQVRCANNLRQVGLAYRVWAMDHNDTFPMELSETNGGTLEFITGPNAFRHFQVMSNELSTPKTLYCMSDTTREIATNFNVLENSNLSYFVGVESSQTNPAMILSGDHGITNGTLISNDIVTLTTKHPAGWMTNVHESIGNVALADGSVQFGKTPKLRELIQHSGVATNRLQMP